jgi:hypothetical protein
MQALCLRRVEAGTTYLDTNQATAWPKTKRICAQCAQEKI